MSIQINLYPFINISFFVIGVAGLRMNQVGLLCGDRLVVSVDDEVLSLKYDYSSNRFIEASKFDGDVNGMCKEVGVDINTLYTTKYFPRMYYTIYKIEFGGRSGYLLERYNGTMASSRFYPCADFNACGEYIVTLEDL